MLSETRQPSRKILRNLVRRATRFGGNLHELAPSVLQSGRVQRAGFGNTVGLQMDVTESFAGQI